MRKTFFLLLCMLSLKSYTQGKSPHLSHIDSILFNTSVDSMYIKLYPLTENYIKIEYVGEQSHPFPTIYIEKSEIDEDSSILIHSYKANRNMIFSFVTYTFLFEKFTYDKFKKWILDGIKKDKYNRSFAKYGTFKICIRNKIHIDTLVIHSIQFIKDLKKQIIDSEDTSYLWVVPALDEFNFRLIQRSLK